MKHAETTRRELQMPFFPESPPEKCCVICRRPADNGDVLCDACAGRIAALIDPPAAQRDRVTAAIAGETDIALLMIARHNATGDWRRVALTRRLDALGSPY